MLRFSRVDYNGFSASTRTEVHTNKYPRKQKEKNRKMEKVEFIRHILRHQIAVGSVIK